MHLISSHSISFLVLSERKDVSPRADLFFHQLLAAPKRRKSPNLPKNRIRIFFLLEGGERLGLVVEGEDGRLGLALLNF
jgi:hypothetical protein